jgi:RNA polymerase sigma-70 factor (ECF subfamily)
VASDHPPASLAQLRADTAWLRRLAGALTHDDAAADDVVQETWVARLAHPPRPRVPVAAWLTVVLRNVARKRARGEVRRRAREEATGASLAEAAPDPETLALRVEAQRAVADLVMALEEPYRSTLLLRYHEGLEPSEIARRLDLPAGTVRWRLKTGLDRVRAALDRRDAGVARRWRALLVPLVPERGSWGLGWKGLMATNATTKGAVLAAVILLAAVGWRVRPERPAPIEEARGPAAEAAAADARARPGRPGEKPRPFGNYQRGARTSVPRFTPPPVANAVAPVPSSGSPPKLRPPGPGPLRNRLGAEAPPNIDEVQARVRDKLDTVHAKAARCLAGWFAPDPALQKGVMLGIELDAVGLQRVWIDDLVDIPTGPLTCLSNAVYELDWGGIVAKPVTVTVRQGYAEE